MSLSAAPQPRPCLCPLVCPPLTLLHSGQTLQPHLLPPHAPPPCKATADGVEDGTKNNGVSDCGMWNSAKTLKKQTNKKKQKKTTTQHFNTSCRERSAGASTIGFWQQQVCCSSCVIKSNMEPSGACCCFPPCQERDKKMGICPLSFILGLGGNKHVARH